MSKKFIVVSLIVAALAVAGARAGEGEGGLAEPDGVLEKLRNSCEQFRADHSEPEYGDVGKIPDFFMGAARSDLKRSDPLSQELATTSLRKFVLRKSPCFVERSRKLAVAENWGSDFLEAFDAAVKWIIDLRQGDPRRVYELSKKYKALAIQGGKYTRQIRNNMSSRLLHLADEMGLPEASFDVAQKYFSETPPKLIGRNMLKRLAGGDYIPAQLDIAERYLEGRGFERDNVLAFYWLSRAALNNAAVGKARLKALAGTLSRNEERAVSKWLRDKKVPILPKLDIQNKPTPHAP